MADDVAGGLIRALIENMSGPVVDWDGWESLAMILEFPEGGFNSAHGFLYSPDGVISAVAANPWAVKPAVTAYTDSHYGPGEALPVKMLLQFDRTSGRYDMTFEDSDEDRWDVNPRTFRTLREELRPKLD